jgi:two-component system chemotaxis sensor kinase CheA
VDDSITSRTLEQSVLAAAGYDVVTAVDGLEAWRLIEREEIALVVSDVEMPHLDGIGLCERIRAAQRTASLPVILVTSLDTPAERARGLEAGADAYVTKSGFDQDILLDTVRQLLGAAIRSAT